eukprot:CAMPEP_0198219652 /NCGR_PEP_ID=MMETSP1445-20131203/75498_1 /TAXON_ID=36898 /ORGANISM="Pyramimonas sp., Strain CCMP2087" /LENGTH=70 /DNA_ID=CAMNT_0043897141 /DNA_START=241 /DNA_END=450 /DNA_ORIENTATION=+
MGPPPLYVLALASRVRIAIVQVGALQQVAQHAVQVPVEDLQRLHAIRVPESHPKHGPQTLMHASLAPAAA